LKSFVLKDNEKMKRRELIRSIALIGLGASVFKYKTLSPAIDYNLPLKIAALGSTPCDMVDYFVKSGLSYSDIYISNHERIKCQGHNISDVIGDLDVFITDSYKYLLIVSPAESDMKELANGMISYLNKINMGYHMIIIGPFPFEGSANFDRTNKLVAECSGARSIKHVEMRKVIDQYGQLNIIDAFNALYDDLLSYIEHNIL
jgi:hypothetical protein